MADYQQRFIELQQLSKSELVGLAKRTVRDFDQRSAYSIGGGSQGTKQDLANAVARMEHPS